MDKIIKVFIFSFFLSFFACSSKSEQQIKADLKTQTLFYTQKKKIKSDLNAILVMSYLNPVLSYKSQDEIFALTLAPKEFKLDSLEIFLAGEKGQITELKPQNEFSDFLIDNPYARYFKVSFTQKELQILKPEVCINLHCFELNFQKYSKSLYYRSVDVDRSYN